MNCLGRVIQIMMLLLLVRLLLLVPMLVAMMLTPPTPLSHLLWSLPMLVAVASDEQYESIPDDEITLLARKF
jgi:Sec-independent protein secretion pathway component TatC